MSGRRCWRRQGSKNKMKYRHGERRPAGPPGALRAVCLWQAESSGGAYGSKSDTGGILAGGGRAGKDPLREFFAEGAEVLWPNTNERFAVEEYLRANCEYPGKWHGKIEKMLDTAEGSVTVTRVWSEEFSVRAISFFRWQGEKILRLEEYWSDDGAPPEWRRKMQIGQKITED